MKKLKLLSVIAAAFLMAGCNKNDDDGNTPNDINGKWNLIKITSPMDGNYEEFMKGTITWTFNKNKQKVNVNDKREVIPLHVGFDLPKDGDYNYNVEVWNPVCDKKLTFDNKNFGCIELNGNMLQLSTAAVDGPIYRFTR
ncbi:hypothetical protein [Flavobacterium cerinum]|uniref:Lipocalin-like domain-containing protein n=1 Tax=Flavobacterium cerinum TaxID=2502784 RepID=A0A444H6J3_9FLAO|nr:hypothetical protein [Flavobacterium cerinum]RWW98795.1 hypothetical protein EPI11_12770 [Flavobacterium cerinum]